MQCESFLACFTSCPLMFSLQKEHVAASESFSIPSITHVTLPIIFRWRKIIKELSQGLCFSDFLPPHGFHGHFERKLRENKLEQLTSLWTPLFNLINPWANFTVVTTSLITHKKPGLLRILQTLLLRNPGLLRIYPYQFLLKHLLHLLKINVWCNTINLQNVKQKCF